MSLLRYNWLRKRGYYTIRGSNYVDPDFGDEWVELAMSNGKKINTVRVSGASTVKEYIAMEKVIDGQKESHE